MLLTNNNILSAVKLNLTRLTANGGCLVPTIFEEAAKGLRDESSEEVYR